MTVRPGPYALHRKEAIMEDFPIWLKAVIYLTVGGTVLYAVGAVVYYNLL